MTHVDIATKVHVNMYAIRLHEAGSSAVDHYSKLEIKDLFMDFTQSFIFDKPSKISIIVGCDSEVIQVPLRALRDFITKDNPGLITHMSAVVLEEAYSRYLRLYKNTDRALHRTC